MCPRLRDDGVTLKWKSSELSRKSDDSCLSKDHFTLTFEYSLKRGNDLT